MFTQQSSGLVRTSRFTIFYVLVNFCIVSTQLAISAEFSQEVVINAAF